MAAKEIIVKKYVVRLSDGVDRRSAIGQSCQSRGRGRMGEGPVGGFVVPAGVGKIGHSSSEMAQA